MPQPITPEGARDLVHDALLKAMPGADLGVLGEHENFREALELDSLDYLNFIEHLGNTAGIRIDEDDYERLSTIQSAVDYLTAPG